MKPLKMYSNQVMPISVQGFDVADRPVNNAVISMKCSHPEIAVLDGFKLRPTGKKFGIVRVSGILNKKVVRRIRVEVLKAPDA